MARSKENFSGSSSLDGKNGMFAMKLTERDYENFTPDFVARKSVFCFDNRMVCLGTGISTVSYTHLDVYKRQAGGCLLLSDDIGI